MNDAIKWTFGQIIYSAVCGKKGIITGMQLRPSGHCYIVSWGAEDNESYCYEFELSEEKVFSE